MTERKHELWVVDRFEDGDLMILERDDGENFVLPRSWLPSGVEEGSVLRLELAKSGHDRPAARPKAAAQEASTQLTFTVDNQETKRRRQERRDQRERLRKAPDGDIEL